MTIAAPYLSCFCASTSQLFAGISRASSNACRAWARRNEKSTVMIFRSLPDSLAVSLERLANEGLAHQLSLTEFLGTDVVETRK